MQFFFAGMFLAEMMLYRPMTGEDVPVVGAVGELK
jgi:hypothetical protein